MPEDEENIEDLDFELPEVPEIVDNGASKQKAEPPKEDYKPYERDYEAEERAARVKRFNDPTQYEDYDTHLECYVTTACIRAAHLPDNCWELEAMRELRGKYVAHLPDGPGLIREYDETSPALVRAIDQRPNSRQIWRSVYDQMIVPIAKLVRQNNYQEAFDQYSRKFQKLSGSFLNV